MLQAFSLLRNNVAEARHLHLMILVRSVGVVDSLRTVRRLKTGCRQWVARVVCFCYREPKGERHVIHLLSCSETLVWRANLNSREWLNLHEELNLGKSFTVTSCLSPCKFSKVKGIAEPCLQDGNSISKWQRVPMIELTTNNREVDLQDMFSCTHGWSSGVQ